MAFGPICLFTLCFIALLLLINGIETDNFVEGVRVECDQGFYCPLTTERQNMKIPCGMSAKQYCPSNHSHPLPTALGHYATEFIMSATATASASDATIGGGQVGGFTSQSKCPHGSYCIDGVKYLCVAGRFGSTMGNTNSSCSGVCTEGHYCPQGSSSSKQYPCGKDATVYCPRGSSEPQRVSRSHYTHGHESSMILDIQTVTFQNINLTSLYCLALSGSAKKYAVCPSGGPRLSPSSTASDIEVYIEALTPRLTPSSATPASSTSEVVAYTEALQKGNDVKVSTPVYTKSGTYSFTVTFTGAYNRYTDLLMAAKDASSPVATTVQVTRISLATETLVGEKYLGLRHTSQSLCEPGYWCDEATGIRHLCPAGRFGSEPGMFSSHCSGLCSEGYFCKEGSTSEKQFKCGGIGMFCPLGSSAPQSVHSGYYTVSSDAISSIDDPLTRVAERKCEPGTWCFEGVKRLCAPGYWGGMFGMSNFNCSGTCSAGFLCPEGSTKPDEVMCGDPNFYCPPQSFAPIRVSEGYFSIGGTESTRSGQTIAPIGKYAHGGLLYTCRAGFYGASEGLTDGSCSGPCLSGFFCPTGSTSPVMKFCGGDEFYCPPASVGPIFVDMGFYTADYLYDECPPGQFRKNSR